MSTQNPYPEPVSEILTMERFLAWEPGGDYNDPFCIATAALAPRSDADGKCDPAHPSYPRVMACFNYPGGSGGEGNYQYVQGFNKFNVYNYNFWQYLDIFVFFAGTTDLGQIAKPPPFWVNAAHRNGVKVLGNLFFQANDTAKLEELVKEDEPGRFPNADKLIRIAQYYGFDGWFLNPEAHTGSALAEKVHRFMKYIQQRKPPGLVMAFYTSITKNGGPSYAGGILTSSNRMFFQDEEGNRASDAVFADFRGLSRNMGGYGAQAPPMSAGNAASYGRCAFDVYTGIDLEYVGWGDLPVKFETGPLFDLVRPEGKPPYTSIGLYAPQFTYYDTPNISRKEYEAREQKLWAGPKETGDWKGIAHYVNARTVLCNLPFYTAFNTGKGEHFFIEGSRMSDNGYGKGGWSNMSMQEVLPTWRMADEGALLHPELVYTEAWNGGSSLCFSGSLEEGEVSLQRLFAAKIKVKSSFSFELALMDRSSAAYDLELGISYKGNNEIEYHRLSIIEKDTWNTSWQEVHLKEERIIEMISIRFNSVAGGDVSLCVGMVRIEERVTPPVAVTDVHSMGDPWFSADGNEAAFNLAWDAAPGAMYYDVYRKAGAGEKTYCGRAFVPVFNFHRFARNNESKSCVSVAAVNSAGYEGEPGTFELLWK